jgi:dipeptidyl aminopeptidase/acylaminoacyl peptidase
LLFEDEGHGFLKKENEIKAYKGINAFLNRYLKGNSVFSNSAYSEIKKK